MRIHTSLAVAALLGAAGAADAALVSTFGFTDLNASWDGQTFHALSLGALPTGGDVTDHTGLPSSATFESGFIGVQNLADVTFRMDVSNITANSADATNGRIVIRDLDNDVLSGSFEGTWSYQFGFGFFDGYISSASYNDAGNGLFEGTDGSGAWATPDGEYIGAISFLVEMPEWFSDAANIERLNASADGMLVTPAPSSVGLLALGGMIATRRRRG